MTDPISYPFPDMPAPGETIEVAPGIQWIRMPLPFQLDHVNLWLLEDEPGWTIIDTGYANSVIQGLLDRLVADRLGGKPIHQVVVTHFHPDHMGNAGWLVRRFGARFRMTRTEWLYARMLSLDTGDATAREMTAYFQRAGLGLHQLGEIAARGHRYHTGVTAVPVSVERMVEGEVLRIGGRDWQVIVGEGHAPEHACLWCEADRIFIAGDQVLPRISPNISVGTPEPEGNPLGGFLKTLDKLRPLPEDALALPSHNTPFHGLRARIEALAAHHDERLDETLDACADGATVSDVMHVLFARRNFDAFHTSLALGESLAHLNYLVAQGRLTRVQEPSGVLRFNRS